MTQHSGNMGCTCFSSGHDNDCPRHAPPSSVEPARDPMGGISLLRPEREIAEHYRKQNKLKDMAEAQREEFEAWCVNEMKMSREFLSRTRDERRELLAYQFSRVENCWRAYQAGAARASFSSEGMKC